MYNTKGTLNQVTAQGRLGQDPKCGSAANGSTYAKFSIATNFKKKDKTEGTEWIPVTAWGQTAKFVQQYIKQGDMVLVQGCIHTNNWESKDGQKRVTTEVLAESVQGVGSKNNSQKQQEPESSPEMPDDDLPF